MKPNSVDPTTLMSQALDGLALRQRVVANNVANVDTPGFKASEVRFEDALRRSLDGDPNQGVRLVRTSAGHLPGMDGGGDAPEVVAMTGTTLRNDGNNVDIEQQMAMLAETTLRFNAVSEALARRFAMLRMVASDGRG